MYCPIQGNLYCKATRLACYEVNVVTKKQSPKDSTKKQSPKDGTKKQSPKDSRKNRVQKTVRKNRVQKTVRKNRVQKTVLLHTEPASKDRTCVQRIRHTEDAITPWPARRLFRLGPMCEGLERNTDIGSLYLDDRET